MLALVVDLAGVKVGGAGHDQQPLDPGGGALGGVVAGQRPGEFLAKGLVGDQLTLGVRLLAEQLAVGPAARPP
ncbi:MAG TPA: hypothetical protein VK280_29625 [Streptosporangiaceae bacterium]|nr:hypothetical protein [Streptosporangiaceae bacterium]